MATALATAVSDAPAVPAERAGRLLALDWTRGLVMILMVIDHAAMVFDAGHLRTDSAFMYEPGMALPAGQFFTRWITHLCAPAFLFLAGTALALSIEKRLARGATNGEIDRYLLTRGLIILAVDPLWFSLLVEGFILQVMYAIGLSFICMIGLRRLSTPWLLGTALFLMVFGEALFGGAMALGGGPTIPAALFVGIGIFGNWIIAYPLLPWLAVMLLGWSFGRYLNRYRAGETTREPGRVLLVGGLVGLSVFAVVRGLNDYGNMLLYRDDGSLIQWLHVSKYPPSLSFWALELGIMGLVAAGFFALQDRGVTSAGWMKPLTVFGQTAMFFYLLHAHIGLAAALTLGVYERLGLAATYVVTAAVVIVMYPLCSWYRGYKAAHPGGWTQYI